MNAKEELFGFIRDEFDVDPDYPFLNDRESAVFRHRTNRKWFALFMPRISLRKLGAERDGEADIVNLKCDPFLSGALRSISGVFPAYHMNKEHWLSVLLDGSVDKETLFGLIAASYELTFLKAKKEKRGRQGSDERVDGKKE